MTDPIHGEDEFILIGLNSLLDKNIDVVYHMRSSRDPETGIQNLRRTIAEPQSKPRRLSRARRRKRAKISESTDSLLLMEDATPAPPPECCNCKPRVARNMSYDTYERYVRDTRAEYEPTGPKSEDDYNTWKALFPGWVRLSDSLTEVTPDPDATCHMTEIQLQAILDSKETPKASSMLT